MSCCWGGTVCRAPAPCFQVRLSILLHLRCSNFILCRFERGGAGSGRKKIPLPSEQRLRQQAILPHQTNIPPPQPTLCLPRLGRSKRRCPDSSGPSAVQSKPGKKRIRLGQSSTTTEFTPPHTVSDTPLQPPPGSHPHQPMAIHFMPPDPELHPWSTSHESPTVHFVPPQVNLVERPISPGPGPGTPLQLLPPPGSLPHRPESPSHQSGSPYQPESPPHQSGSPYQPQPQAPTPQQFRPFLPIDPHTTSPPPRPPPPLSYHLNRPQAPLSPPPRPPAPLSHHLNMPP